MTDAIGERLARVEEKIAALADKIEERDRRYQERFNSQQAAIGEAKDAQDAYNVQHNDLIRKGEAQAANVPTRAEMGSELHRLEDRIARDGDAIAVIQKSLAAGGGATQGAESASNKNRNLIIFAITVLGFVVMAATLLINVAMKWGKP